jgi:hypothetical protein
LTGSPANAVRGTPKKHKTTREMSNFFITTPPSF